MDKEKAQEKYGEYFMNRTVADIMDEYEEQRDEWKPIEPKDTPEKEEK